MRFHATSYVGPFQKLSCIFYPQILNSFPSGRYSLLRLLDFHQGIVSDVFGGLFLDAELWGVRERIMYYFVDYI